MRQSSEFDAFEQFIRQSVDAFEEVPSERVWEGLEGKWNQRNNGFFRGDLFWLFVGISMITGTALWGWHSVDEMESQVPKPLIVSERKVQLPEHIPTFPAPVQPTLIQTQQTSPVLAAIDSVEHVLTAQPSFPFYSQETTPVSPDSSTSVFGVESLPQPVEATADFASIEKDFSPDLLPLHFPKKPRIKKKKVKKKKAKYRPKFGSEDWWSSPNSWKNGKSWDYQIGLSYGGDNTYRDRRLVPLNQERSSITDLELRFEWVPNHRLRISSGLGTKRIDFRQHYSVTNPALIYNTINGLELPLDTAEVEQMNNTFLGNTLFIPIDILMFFTQPEKETQIYGGIGFQQGIIGRYQADYEFRLIDNQSVYATSPYFSQRNLWLRSYRLSAGVEQRLSKALRIRAQGTVGISSLFYSSDFMDRLAYGANVSLYWASPRGPMRWRKQRRNRIH